MFLLLFFLCLLLYILSDKNLAIAGIRIAHEVYNLNQGKPNCRTGTLWSVAVHEVVPLNLVS